MSLGSSFLSDFSMCLNRFSGLMFVSRRIARIPRYSTRLLAEREMFIHSLTYLQEHSSRTWELKEDKEFAIRLWARFAQDDPLNLIK